MVFEEFIEAVKEQLYEILGDDVILQQELVAKNNGIMLMGLIIRQGENKISPTIYLDGYYRAYEEKNIGTNYEALAEIAQDIICQYNDCKVDEEIDFDMLSDFEKMKACIAYRIVNYEKNKELLKIIPHEKYLDLAIVYYCSLYREEYGHATMLIHNSHLDMWKVTMEDVKKAAEDNTERLFPYQVKPLRQLVETLPEYRMIPEEKLEIAPKMYVLTTDGYGASVIRYTNLLKDLSIAMKADLIVLPSSIYEVIVMEYQDELDLSYLNEMVVSVNEEIVDEMEQLSDHAYLYKRTLDELYVV